MNCFPCFTSTNPDEEDEEKLPVAQAQAPLLSDTDNGEIAAKAFTFREMAVATKNFRQECVLFDDGFGRVFRGTLKSTGQVVAVKQLDRNGINGTKEFLDEVKALSPLKHPNLISLIGYCADGEQRILVYEHMQLGSLETNLLDRPADNSPLDWITRMKIATGAAQGLEYLHEEAKPPIIYRDFKSSKILLDDDYNARLCDFGLGKLADAGNTATIPARVMGTYGYSAPEYASSGELTMKSDIYSFGVVLLELITGRRAIDPNRPANEQNLVTWAQPIFKDPKRFPEMADPLLNKKFSVKSLNQAVGVAAMCLQEEPTVRPYITDVVAALSFLELDAKDPPAPEISPDQESLKESNDSIGDECSRYSDDEDNDDNHDNDSRAESSSDHEDTDDISKTRDDDHKSFSSDEEEHNSDINKTENKKSNSSMDHEDDVNKIEEEHSNSSMDHEDDEAALTIEFDHEHSPSISLQEDSGEGEYDEPENESKDSTKSMNSTNSKKGKVMEISDDESIYSSSSSRSSSSSSSKKDETAEKKSTRQTVQRVKSKLKSNLRHAGQRRIKNNWRKAKSALHPKSKK